MMFFLSGESIARPLVMTGSNSTNPSFALPRLFFSSFIGCITL